MTSTLFSSASDEEQIEAAKLIGGLVGFLSSGGDAGAVNAAAEIAGSAQTFNRQLHREEVALIKGKAAEYAVIRGWCATKEECASNQNALFRAQAELMAQALWRVDVQARRSIYFDEDGVQTIANKFLETIGAGQDIVSGNGTSVGQKYFQPINGQENNPLLNQAFIQENRDFYNSDYFSQYTRDDDNKFTALLRADAAQRTINGRNSAPTKEQIDTVVYYQYGGDRTAFENDIRATMAGLILEAEEATWRLQVLREENPGISDEAIKNDVNYLTLQRASQNLLYTNNIANLGYLLVIDIVPQ